MGILFSDFHRTGILVHPHACVFFFFGGIFVKS